MTDLLARLLDGVPTGSRRLDCNGVATHVLEAGTGAPVVLLHGIGSFAAEWLQVIPILAGSHRVIAPDMPGLGASAVAGRRLDVTFISEWLLDVIARTCEEPPTLVGHSMGGGIAARFAAERPDHLRGAILVDSSSLGPFRPSARLMVAVVRYGSRPTRSNRDRFLRRVLSDPDGARARWGSRWAALEAYDLEQAATKTASAANGQFLRKIGARRVPPEMLRAIERPVSLVWGRGDELMRFTIAERAAARYGWPLHPIDACGHGPHIERPDELSEAIRAAL